MMFERRAYQSADDLKKIQDAMSLWVSIAGDCGYIHRGDVRHRLFNGARLFDPHDIVYLWEDASGNVIGWVMMYPHWKAMECNVHPDYRCGDFHHVIRDWAESEIIRRASALDGAVPVELIEDVIHCDLALQAFMEARGYEDVGHRFNYTERNLEDLPQPQLADGYYFHLADISQTEKLAEVHNYSFTKKWTGESYRQVMEAPGHEYEFVVVAPDGRFAAFTQVWVDERNKSILFEPVGTHKDFQRQGIGKAIMLNVLHWMKREHQTEKAIVWHEVTNVASTALYASLGFKVKYQVHEYAKDLRSDQLSTESIKNS